ncbi:MAG: hypothetical protein CMF89_04340 [Candidatus Marinimicrobia bacterium]|nr:hypothetical protein [Candidatus Neomarinimicrobiota bacterium]|tara:strand:+ start:17277 stop:18404 length:1128 start_codon:yes stop_codon:yes gene_type:complete
MNVYLHIGPAKTGSTSIQLSLNRFENDDYFYADFEEFEKIIRFGNGNHSAPLKFLFEDKYFEEKCKLLKISKTEGSKIRSDLDNHLNKMIESKKSKSIIFSGEGLGFMNGKSTKNLKNKFNELGCSLTLIYYYREPLDRAKSQIQQKNKNHHFALSDYRYKSVQENLRFYVKHFDKEQLLVRSFKDLKNGSVVDDFCDIFDIELGENKVNDANKSMTEDAFKILYYRSKVLIKNGAEIGREIGKDKIHRKIRNLYSNSKNKLDSEHFRIACQVNKNDEIKYLQENTTLRYIDDDKKESDLKASFSDALEKFLVLLKIKVKIETEDDFEEYFSDISRIDHSNLNNFLEENGLDTLEIKQMHFDNKLKKLDEILYPK